MELARNKFGKVNLLMWRTESIFFNKERRALSEEWNGVRFTTLPYPAEPYLINSSLKGRLPYPDNTFDAIYSFHVFEHLTYDEGLVSLREMCRVLKPGGICRISTPDLLFFANEYLQQYHAINRNGGDEKQAFRYEWSVLNLIDQAVRKEGGGRMVQALLGPEVDVEYLKYTNGDSLSFMIRESGIGQHTDSARRPTYFSGRPSPVLHQVKKIFYTLLRKVIIRLSPLPAVELLNERNRWLYDPKSLADLYKLAGFADTYLQDYKTSLIEGWERYNFDGSVMGDYPLEPSLYMEGRK